MAVWRPRFGFKADVISRTLCRGTKIICFLTFMENIACTRQFLGLSQTFPLNFSKDDTTWRLIRRYSRTKCAATKVHLIKNEAHGWIVVALWGVCKKWKHYSSLHLHTWRSKRGRCVETPRTSRFYLPKLQHTTQRVANPVYGGPFAGKTSTCKIRGWILSHPSRFAYGHSRYLVSNAMEDPKPTIWRNNRRHATSISPNSFSLTFTVMKKMGEGLGICMNKRRSVIQPSNVHDGI